MSLGKCALRLLSLRGRRRQPAHRPAGASRRYDRNTYRRTTLHQYQTAAHLAYARGLDGVSLFNFAYYREHGARDRGPFHEPPFEVIPHLSDRAWLARQPQHYIWRVNKMTKVGGTRSPRLQNAQFPEIFSAGHTAVWPMDMAPPQDGWQADGILRIQAAQPLGATTWQARFNGTTLTSSTDVSEPSPTPYPNLLGTPEQHRAWTVPRDLLRDGKNLVEVTMASGQPSKKIVFLDISVQ